MTEEERSRTIRSRRETNSSIFLMKRVEVGGCGDSGAISGGRMADACAVRGEKTATILRGENSLDVQLLFSEFVRRMYHSGVNEEIMASGVKRSATSSGQTSGCASRQGASGGWRNNL